jgi:hypothetical protein
MQGGGGTEHLARGPLPQISVVAAKSPPLRRPLLQIPTAPRVPRPITTTLVLFQPLPPLPRPFPTIEGSQRPHRAPRSRRRSTEVVAGFRCVGRFSEGMEPFPSLSGRGNSHPKLTPPFTDTVEQVRPFLMEDSL